MKKRVEVIFTEQDSDLWDFICDSDIAKATLLKKALRAYMSNANPIIDEGALEQKIRSIIATMHTAAATVEAPVKKPNKPSFGFGKEF